MTWYGPGFDAPFDGAKLAILSRGRIVVLLRDADPDIPFPDMWDLPGGGREDEESPLDCVLRETEEEIGLRLDPDAVGWGRRYSAIPPDAVETWFFVMRDDSIEAEHLQLGDEGQCLELMPVEVYLDHPRVIPHMAERLRHYLAEEGYARN